MELEQKVKDILEGFEDEDLKGTYYPLKGMDEETRQQLVDDHFLFKKGDRFLESAGINQFWPNGRGIFFNTNKTFLVWVNEEDQLRIISMEQGANIKSVFGRLQKAVAAINAKLEFAYNDQLGYLTACPTNIGCGERASVHIKVPLTSQKKDVFDAIAKKHNLQIRGVHGEHSESKGGIYDVSNKRRLGISEWDGVKDLINGCQELMETEARLAKESPEEKEEESKDASIDDLYAKLAASDAKSLLKKYLTKEIFEKLKDKVTSQGCDFKSSIRSGIDNLDSGVGVYASDYEAYTLFADLLNPIIIDYHKLGSLDGFKHPKQNFAFDDKMVANVDPEGKFVVSTRIRVARNVQGYPLRGGMSAKQTMELEAKLKAILEGFEDEDLKGKYYPLKGMDEKTRQQLVDDHFLFKKGDRFLHSAGINNNWPDGRGIFFNNAKTFLVWVNEEDQLRIISMEQGANIKSVFGRLQKAVAAINAKLEFAYNDQLGYLTACPTNIGCGERASVHIKVPLVSQNQDLFDDIAKRNNLQIRGVDGEHSESKSGIYDVSNKRRLGITEWDGVKDLINGCKELIENEMRLQSELDSGANQEEKVEAESDQSVDFLFTKLENSDAKSMLKKYLTKEIFEALKDVKTKQGCDLESCIKSGIDNPDSGIGVYASDSDAYVAFADLLNPIIIDYHKLD
eukprot:543232_1